MCGVLQGSVLGSLLFLIYINDICHLSNLHDLVLFADDTNLFSSHNDIHTLTHTIFSEMLELSGLALNVKKSNYVIFKPRQRREEFDFNIEINGHNMIRSALRKLLFLVIFWMKNFHGNHVAHILLAKFLNLLVLLVDQVLVSLSFP